MAGDIFLPRSADPQGRATFEQAFPDIRALDVIVRETGEGNKGLGERRFHRRSVREFINCSSHRCAGKGFSLGAVMRRMANLRQPHLRLDQRCESTEESGRPCPNRFAVELHIDYDSDARDSKSPFGVLAFLHWNHSWNNYLFSRDDVKRSVTLIEKAGIEWVRLDILWSDVEPEQGRFNFDRYEVIVDHLRNRDRRILGVLHYNPLWRGGDWNQPPIPDDYCRYVKATVARFRDRIGFWEVWNEPDHPIYWRPQDDLTAYSALLKRAYSQIKTSDPTARVVLGGLAMEPAKKIRWIYEKAGRDAFDVANIHPFTAPGQLDQVRTFCEEVRAEMARQGDEAKPLWLTEIGCPGLAPQIPSKGWWLGGKVTEDEQASWLETVYREAMGWTGVQKIFWAFFRDTGAHFKDDVDYFGLVRHDFSEKPAFKTYKAVTR